MEAITSTATSITIIRVKNHRKHRDRHTRFHKRHWWYSAEQSLFPPSHQNNLYNEP